MIKYLKLRSVTPRSTCNNLFISSLNVIVYLLQPMLYSPLYITYSLLEILKKYLLQVEVKIRAKACC